MGNKRQYQNSVLFLNAFVLNEYGAGVKNVGENTFYAFLLFSFLSFLWQECAVLEKCLVHCTT